MRRRVDVFLTGAMLMIASSAFAQDESRGEVSAGWRHYHVTLSSVLDPVQLDTPNDYPTGWYADVAFNLSKNLRSSARPAARTTRTT